MKISAKPSERTKDGERAIPPERTKKTERTWFDVWQGKRLAARHNRRQFQLQHTAALLNEALKTS
jgi:hypothetical protein